MSALTPRETYLIAVAVQKVFADQAELFATMAAALSPDTPPRPPSELLTALSDLMALSATQMRVVVEAMQSAG